MRFVLCVLLALSASAAAAEVPFVNWENHPVHALDLSPDGRLLAVAHTSDQRVQLFDVSTGTALPVGHVVVGVDPVSVRFRTDGELWVVNHVSDSVSVVDVAAREVRATLATADEPFDVVFAPGPTGDRAFVSCSQANRVLVFETGDLARAPAVVAIDAEDPRALAVSADGRTVYAAIFESGNGSTLLAGGLVNNTVALPNVVGDPRGPYAGRNPPPNRGELFEPPLDTTAPPPRVGLIVKKDGAGRWRDDNARDWSDFVTGPLAAASGRRTGWDLPDRDLALIDTSTLAVRWVSGLMNVGMALAIHPATGDATLVGTDATNEIRYEPNVNGRFVRVMLARANDAGSKSVTDLNPHLDYRAPRVAQAQRDQSLGDPRAIAWRPDGSRGWIAGLGSNNVIAIDAQGRRSGAPIAVGQGPIGLALDAQRDRLYVWNHFEASLSVVDASAGTELARVPVFDPLPVAIRNGRPLLYDTHRTSGLGQAACASCHVDARMDRLAWDLGDPSQPPAAFDQNCVTTQPPLQPCQAFHAMKGPMTTQTLQDIVGNEPFHWRGDRQGIEAFNPAFEGLLGDDVQLTDAEMQAFEDFLATIAYPPNPFRNLDNSLPSSVALDGHYTSGRFAMAGQPLGTGNAVRGLQLYTRGLLDAPFQCASCHTLPTGMAVNGPLLIGLGAISAGGMRMATGPLGQNHLGIVSVDGSTNVSIKVPHLRNQYDKVGFETTQLTSRAGFGFLHDGSVDSLSRFMAARTFSVQSDQDVADLVALMLAFSGSGFAPSANPLLGATPPDSQDSHAAEGAQATLTSGAPDARASQLLALAAAGAVDLIARSAGVDATYDRANGRFALSDGTTSMTTSALLATASAAAPLTLTAVPVGLGARLGVDRDGDGVADAAELARGSDPADAASTALRGRAGLWYNPQRSGHGMDLQYLGANMFATWYTYDDAGNPTWYLASGAVANPWTASLDRFTWNPQTNFVDIVPAGTLTLSFENARDVRFDWRLGTRSGSERMIPLAAPATPFPDRTGTWYDPREPGWGLSIYTEGDVRLSVLYFYDGANQPRWVLAQDANTASAELALQSYRGFCPDCAATTPATSAGGTLTLQFDGARRVSVATDAFASSPSARWQRVTTLVPLSDAASRPETR